MIRILSFSYKHMKAVEVKCTIEQYKGIGKEYWWTVISIGSFVCVHKHICAYAHTYTHRQT